LRAARRSAKLWKGEDISGLLLIRNGSSKPQTATDDNTHELQLSETIRKGCGCAVRNQRPSSRGNLDVGARQRPLILPKAAHIERKLLQASA
jgi:hypothetical protein